MGTKIARGAWQEGIYQSLIAGEKIIHPVGLLKGDKKYKFSEKYTKSFENLLERMEKAGYVVHCEPAVEGGYLDATFSVSKQEAGQSISPAEKRWY